MGGSCRNKSVIAKANIKRQRTDIYSAACMDGVLYSAVIVRGLTLSPWQKCMPINGSIFYEQSLSSTHRKRNKHFAPTAFFGDYFPVRLQQVHCRLPHTYAVFSVSTSLRRGRTCATCHFHTQTRTRKGGDKSYRRRHYSLVVDMPVHICRQRERDTP